MQANPTFESSDRERHCASEDEYQVAGKTHPLDHAGTVAADIVKTAGMAVAVLHHVPYLQHAAGERKAPRPAPCG